jgi:hypothetical protein
MAWQALLAHRSAHHTAAVQMRMRDIPWRQRKRLRMRMHAVCIERRRFRSFLHRSNICPSEHGVLMQAVISGFLHGVFVSQ